MLSKPNREHPERLKCPAHFQQRITQVGGLNRYRKPNFKLVWAQTETTKKVKWDGEEFDGYEDALLGDGLPHWMLLQWVDAGKCHDMPHLPPQSDISWYHQTLDAATGVQLCGEYAYRGKYEIVLPLMSKIWTNGQLIIRAFPLSTEIIEMMVPIIKASMELSLKYKMQFMKDEKEKEESERLKQFDDLYHDIHRKSTLASTSWLEDKQRSIEKNFNAALVSMLYRNKFMQTQGRL